MDLAGDGAVEIFATGAAGVVGEAGCELMAGALLGALGSGGRVDSDKSISTISLVGDSNKVLLTIRRLTSAMVCIKKENPKKGDVRVGGVATSLLETHGFCAGLVLRENSWPLDIFTSPLCRSRARAGPKD